jgi:Na+-transporting NADH:ubiquinone oxidoreductase subunit B
MPRIGRVNPQQWHHQHKGGIVALNLKTLFLWQKPMQRVKYSLIPIVLLSTWFFGLRVLILQAVVLLAGMAAEYLIMRTIQGEKTKITEAVHVTCVLYALTLPPTVPYWVAVVGIVFGVVFGKGVFGGFGRNIFNPALVARCFVYVAFPSLMTITWAKPMSGFPGGFLRYASPADLLTMATPIITRNKTGQTTPYLDLFLGNIAGSMGETSALLILAAAVYLVITKTASWKIIVSCMASYMAFSSLFYAIGFTPVDPLFALLSGGFLFGAVFMATDPVSAPKDDLSRVIYGALIGLVTFIIRRYSLFTEGMMFAILIGNMFVPLLERHVAQWKTKGKAKGKKVAA